MRLIIIGVVVSLAVLAAVLLTSGSQASAPGVQGDINCSGHVDHVDALQILRVAARLSADASCLALGDVNCDGHVDPADAFLELKYEAGIRATGAAALSASSAQNCPAIGSSVGSPTPSATASRSPTPKPTPTSTATPTPTPTPTPTATSTPTATPSATPHTPTPIPTPTPTCAPGTAGCGWRAGDLTTYVQAAWSDGTSTAGMLLSNDYNTLYFSTGGLFVIGSSTDCTSSRYIIQFDSAQALQSYLPQSGPAGALTGCLANPTYSASGVFGGDVAGLKLNIDFTDAGDVTGNSGLKFGDLRVCGLTSDTDLNGQAVRQFLGTASTALGGGTHIDSISDLDAIAAHLNASFGGGTTPSTFAQDHLVNGACP